RLTAAMSKRFAANKEKVKIVPTAKVRSYVNSRSIDGNLVDKHDLGKHFKADYVIALEISPGLSLYEYKSPQLYRGSGEIAVAVLDVRQPKDEATIFQDVYRTEFPKRGPIDAGGSSVLQFRGLFLNHIANDLSKYFAGYP